MKVGELTKNTINSPSHPRLPFSRLHDGFIIPTTKYNIVFLLLTETPLTKTEGSGVGVSTSGRTRSGVVARSGDDLSGQITEELMGSMRVKIATALGVGEGEGDEAGRVVVSDASGDGSHVSIDVVSSAFEGKTSVQRQRLVYKAIWEELQEAVHAVDAMTCKTPSEERGE